MKKGNVLIIATIFIAIAIVIILFIAVIFMSHVNSILYNVKTEIYSMNKSAIIAVNKNETSIGNFSFNKKAYKEYFENVLKENYKLDNNFRNKEKLISSVKIVEYDIYEKGKKDHFTDKKCEDRMIHTVLEIKMKPIIMQKFFEKIFTFEIHEDVILNSLNMGER